MRRGGRGGGGGVAASLAALLWCGCVVLALAAAAAAQGPRLPSAYKTLSGDAPRIVAKGGFSGVFPDSSSAAYSFALSASAPDTTLWCDVQLTKDGVGVCLRDINMQNCTNVAQAYTARKRTYVIDGVRKTGWFASDFTMAELQSVVLTQAIWSRSPRFDGYPILSVTDLPTILDVKQPSVWLNVQHDIFYKEHGLNMRNYILSIQKNVSVHYISSPELGFLQNISGRVHRKTKLVFSFLDKALLDNSIHRTYGSLLSNLTFVKSIASGIMVPKSYIWPVTKDNYLQQAPTSIVAEAHSAGLEIYASDFANDRIIPYNYSYDPLAEYLNFISDGGFSVDGVLSEHPITASGAIGCFANLNSSKTDHGEPLIISHNGASGDYPDCTDLAYHSAINDGADVIDCPVQVTSDGTLMCMSSVNLLDTTNVQRTPFSSRASVVSEIQATPGVFTFNLTWDDINSSIQPKISSPLSRYYVVRNPRYTNQGKFLKLSDFLAMGMDKDLSGVMIIIENAAFLAKSLGIDIVDSVNAALNAAGYDNQTAKGVLIQSKDSAVLVKLKQQKTKCKLVYTLPSGIGDVSTSSLEAVKKFADAVVVDKDNSVFTSSLDFIIRQNNLMKDLQSSGLAVYAQVFRNEFLSQPLDFFSDETVEINYYFQSFNLSGIITDFPKTVRRYKKNTCTGLGNDMPNYMQAVPIGALDQLLQKFKAQPPSMPPMPTLNASDVVETPLPPVAPRNEPGGSPRGAETPGLSIGLGVGGGISLLLALGTPFLIHKIKLQRAKKRRENFFNQNHGLLLQQLVSHNADIGERMIITLRELEKATNNFDRARVIGGGGHGVVFKGMIDLKVVAIKKSRILVQREIDEFINEVAVLSQVNHRNVVKLLGCCLETEVPLLVYEFISNGTLYQHLHVQGPVSLPRADRIRIALEVARALSYLHSAASMPIFHRDIKSANILLDDSLVAKVSDFGASRYIPIDKTGITTAVQGTIGYLDPEYYYTGRLTDKSDVFSFGVLLVELLTRKKPFVYRTDDGDGLVSHFVSLLTEGKLVDLIDPQIIEDEDGEVYEVAILAAMCTKLRREDRPTMREAEMRLENLLVKKNQIPYIMAPRGYNEHNTLVHCMSIEKVNKEASRQYTMEDEIILSATYPR